MREERKVVLITGASQGIGAGLVKGFLDRGYCVVANSRTIEPGTSPDLLTVAGDIADPETARYRRRGDRQLRSRRYAGE
jgi:NAD(P)-dependent dehydrogenase (short-subunit alcohol dehydrogenase family)